MRVSPEEIKQLRKDLNLSARELATSIKAETEDVWAWETGERFPTKRFVTRMLALRKTGAPKRPPANAPEPKAAAADADEAAVKKAASDLAMYKANRKARDDAWVRWKAILAKL